MTITVHPSTKTLSSVNKWFGQPATDAQDLFKSVCGEVSQKCSEIFQSSFAAGSLNSSSNVSASAERFAFIDLSKAKVFPKSNGLVNTAVQAYNNHHHLVIRPDDVWIAILSQFNLYLNANTETFRRVFKGKKERKIVVGGTRYNVDFKKFATYMGILIQRTVKDPEWREWIIPDFSTTTENDRIVSSVVMMATLNRYFSYSFRLECGLPAVTLMGEKADWEKLLARAEKLPSHGEQMAKWHSLLKPVLAGFVHSFEEPDSQGTKDFWQTIAHYSGGGSGPTYLSGWITAFCFFDNKGKPLHSKHSMGKGKNWESSELGNLKMDGVEYHRVEIEDIPPGYAEVDVKLIDNGRVFQTIMVAGLVGMGITNSDVKDKDHDGKDDTVQPVAGWWLCNKVPSVLNFIRAPR